MNLRHLKTAKATTLSRRVAEFLQPRTFDSPERTVEGWMQTERLTQKPDFLKLVDKVDGQTVPQGNALILGQFPPMTSAASYHASALLHALKTSGYHITSMAGPGLSVARRTCVFVSNQKLRKSTAFLDNERASDIAVVYAKALEFARISKPTWYKRRVEEIRRIALFARILGRSKRTVLVLEDASLLRRDAWAFGLTGVLVSFARWKRFSITQRRRPPHIVAERLTGTAQLPADVHAAEHSSYDASDRSRRKRTRTPPDGAARGAVGAVSRRN